MFEDIAGDVRIIEVGPRDGLQNETRVIKTEDKLSFILKLAQAGLSSIEAAAFVRPGKVPQMADGEKLFSLLRQTPELEGVEFPVLVPNRKGLEKALGVKADYFSLLTATSETFSQRNINADVSESLKRISDIIDRLEQLPNCRFRVYISTVFGCPYEGKMASPNRLMDVVEKLLGLGVSEIVLGDTTGAATPKQGQRFSLRGRTGDGSFPLGPPLSRHPTCGPGQYLGGP